MHSLMDEPTSLPFTPADEDDDGVVARPFLQTIRGRVLAAVLVVPLFVSLALVAVRVVGSTSDDAATVATVATVAIAAALVIGTTIGVLLARSQLGLLDEVVQAVQRIAAGDLGTRSAIRREDQVGDLALGVDIVAARLAKSSRQLEERLADERERATRDALTGLRNRAYLDRLLEAELARAEQEGWQVSLAVLYLENFRQINDEHGRAAGDEVLQRAARLLEAGTRRFDTAARLGGAAFAVVLPATTAPEARTVCAELVERLGELGVGDIQIGAHGGVVDTSQVGAGPVEAMLWDRAEDAAVAARTRRHEDVVAWSPGIEPADPDAARRTRTHRDVVASTRVLARAMSGESHPADLARDVAVELARRGGFSGGDARRVGDTCYLLDVAEAGLEPAAAREPGPISDADLAELRRHAVVAARVASRTGLDVPVEWILHHHERWDGTGHPAGLQGEQIPYAARILLLAEALPAMLEPRPWRAAMTLDEAVAEATSHAGTQFDPRLVEHLAAAHADGTLRRACLQHGYRHAAGDDGGLAAA